MACFLFLCCPSLTRVPGGGSPITILSVLSLPGCFPLLCHPFLLARIPVIVTYFPLLKQTKYKTHHHSNSMQNQMPHKIYIPLNNKFAETQYPSHLKAGSQIGRWVLLMVKQSGLPRLWFVGLSWWFFYEPNWMH